MTDGALLAALLDHPGLTDRERSAFEDMIAGAMGRFGCLTLGQRHWAQGVAARLGITGAVNPGPAPDLRTPDPYLARIEAGAVERGRAARQRRTNRAVAGYRSKSAWDPPPRRRK